MTKKKLKEMDNEALIIEFVGCYGQLKTSYRFHKCDIKAFDNAIEELVNRSIIKKETAEQISHMAMR